MGDELNEHYGTFAAIALEDQGWIIGEATIALNYLDATAHHLPSGAAPSDGACSRWRPEIEAAYYLRSRTRGPTGGQMGGQ